MHSPGPWKEGKKGIEDANGKLVIDCENCTLWPFEKEEDRKLVLAAPALLEALKEILPQVELELIHRDMKRFNMVKRARAAAAHAEGKE